MCIIGNKVLILKRVMQLFILQQLKVLVYRIAVVQTFCNFSGLVNYIPMRVQEIFAGANFCEDAIKLFFVSARIIIDHSNSKIYQFIFSCNQHGHEKRKKFAPCKKFPAIRYSINYVLA